MILLRNLSSGVVSAPSLAVIASERMRSPLAGSSAIQPSGAATGGAAGAGAGGGGYGAGGGNSLKERERVLMLRERDGEAYRAALAAANARSGHSVSRLYSARLSAGGGGAQANVPEELIQQVLTVLQGKSRQLVMRELQRCVCLAAFAL